MLKVLTVALIFIAVTFSQSDAATSGEKIKVVTTIPSLKEFAIQIGGDRVDVYSLLKGGEDIHTFDPRPGDIRAISGAAILIRIGAGLDPWVNKLIAASGNKKIRILEASKGIEISQSAEITPSHPEGNPHIWLDPVIAITILENIYHLLDQSYPGNTRYFKANLDMYVSKLRNLENELRDALSGISDHRVVSYHPGWNYLLQRFQLAEIFSIERFPGREPSARDIAVTIDRIRKEKIRLIVSGPEAPAAILDIIKRESGASSVIIAPEIGSLPSALNYVEMLRFNIKEIARGLR